LRIHPHIKGNKSLLTTPISVIIFGVVSKQNFGHLGTSLVIFDEEMNSVRIFEVEGSTLDFTEFVFG
jgi:hypothetical protein